MAKAGANRPGRDWLKAQAGLSRGPTLQIVGRGLVTTALAVLQAWCLARLVAPVLQGKPIDDLSMWAGLFAAAALVRAALLVSVDGVGFEAGTAARRRLRTEFLVRAFALGPHRSQPPGEAVATAIDGVDGLDGYFGRWLPAATMAWAAPLLVLVAMASADPVAAAITACGGIVVPVGMAVAGVGAAVASRQQFEAMARLQSRFLDRMRGIATIVLAGQAEAEAGRLDAAARDLSGRTMRVLRVAFLSSAVLDAAAAAVLIVLAVRIGLDWNGGTLRPVTSVLTLLLVAEFFAPLRAFSAAYQDRIAASTAASRLDMGAAPDPVAALPPVRTVAAAGVTIAFEAVSFTWPGSDPDRRPAALDQLSFRVPANETAVLIGPSGAGKSTVIELLLGFIQPDSGRVTLNGADLSTITPAALSRMTAWIGQRPVLFAGSIRDNIRFGNQDASEASIEQAAASAGLVAVAALLPDGLDTVIGEGGYGLSGGQAQRVAIARAFVRNAPLLLLDEPTAHLDPATEADVLDSLRRLALGRTVILASHSSAAMAFGSRRIVLEAGRIMAPQGVGQGAA